MSCRTGSNSVITSLTQYFVARRGFRAEDESTIKKVFHELKREADEALPSGAGGHAVSALGRDRDVEQDPSAPAPQADVEEFLRAQASEVRNDPAMKPARKDRLLMKLDAAVASVRAGDVPDQGTFYAWTRLRSAAHDRIQSQAHDETMMRISEGESATHAEVLEAFEYQRRLRRDIEQIRVAARQSSYSRDAKEEETEIVRRLAQVEQDCRTLVRSYDATPDGQRDLRAGLTDRFDSVFPGGRQERAGGNAQPATQAMTADEALGQYMNAVQQHKHARKHGTPRQQEQTRQRLRTIEMAIGSAVADHPQADFFATVTDTSIADPGTWDVLLGGELTTDQKNVGAEAFLFAYRKRLERRLAQEQVSVQEANRIYELARQAKAVSVSRG